MKPRPCAAVTASVLAGAFLALVSPPFSLGAMAAVRTAAYVALAARAVWLPSRGRFAALLTGQAVEAVVRAAFGTLGMPLPPGLSRAVARHLADLGHAAFNIDDVSSSLAAVGMSVLLQDRSHFLAPTAAGSGHPKWATWPELVSESPNTSCVRGGLCWARRGRACCAVPVP
jgi:hypothetical protein